jgi:hypothetical protein
MAALCSTLVGCGSDDEEGEAPDPYVGAPGVTIQQVAIYQSLKRTLMLAGAPQAGGVPLVAGRDAMVRIYYTTDGSYDGQPVTGRLHLPGQEPLETTAPLAAASVEEDLATTVNVSVPGSRIGPTFDYRVSLAQNGSNRDDNPTAHYPGGGATESVPVDGPANKLRVIIAPFAYEADGSGRLPNTSPEQIEAIRQRFRALYPVSDVEISVRDPEPWTIPIDPGGSGGWTQLGIELLGYRSNDGVGDDVYYYGMFNPADTLYAYCGMQCVLGMTLMNDNPPETGTVMLRLAIGVGFDAVAASTAVHELGHSHGLAHAPCGPGLAPDSIDLDYPHADGVIGVWGYDPLLGQLLSPTVYTDMMSYCDVNWISDYHYVKLLARSGNVNLPSWQPPPEGAIEYQLITLDGDGHGAFQLVTERARPLAGTPLPVAAETTAGTQATVNGRYFPYDHLPGGWLFVPTGGEQLDRVELRLDGTTVVAHR